MKKRNQLLSLLFCFVVVLGNAQNAMVQSLLNDVRLDSLKHFVRQLTGGRPVKIGGQVDTIKSRFYQHPDNEKAFQFMKGEFLRYGYLVDSMQFSPLGKNLFAIKPGYKHPNQRFMLGAHYDNLPDSTEAPGADDNASGTATVLEAGRIFRNYSFPYTIVFALWDEEEPGLIGSMAYAPTVGSDNETLIGYVNVDMLGWDGNNDSVADLNVRPVANSMALAARAQQCNTVYNIGLGIHVVNPGSGNTDHAPFWYNNQTAIGIDEEYDNDFNPYWHTLADSLGQFNLSFYQKCSKLGYATIADCALDTVNTVGINEFSLRDGFMIYPNPFTSEVYIRSKLPGENIDRIVIADAFGKVIYEQAVGVSTARISATELSPGVYFIRTYTKDASSVKKLIKQ